MKTIKILSLTIAAAFAVFSCKSDDEFYNAANLKVPNLIVLDVQSGYTVGEDLTFHTEFSRYLPEENQTQLLDIYKTSNAESFGFAYRIEKQTTSGDWETALPNEDEYAPVDAVYDSATEMYSGNYAVRLNETGNYRFSFGQSYTGSQSTDLISRNPANKTLVRITTNSNGVDSQGHYYFTVN